MHFVNLPVDPDVKPIRKLDERAVDSHFHVFENQSIYPYTDDRSFTPVNSTWAQYEHVSASMGSKRGVLVHPSVYGFDLSSLIYLLEKHHTRLKAVCVLRPDTSMGQVEYLHNLGVRGVRINVVYKGGGMLEDAVRLADLVKPFGWHIQFLADVSANPELPLKASQLGVTVVFDHFGHPSNRSITDPGFNNLCAAVQDGVAWVKLSGAYRFAKTMEKSYSVQNHVDKLLRANPAHLVWGSDWPHTQIIPPMPNDGQLVDDIYEWLANDEDLIEKVLIKNPENLYKFDSQ